MISRVEIKLSDSWRKYGKKNQLVYYFIFGIIGIALFYFVIKDQGTSNLINSLKEVNYWWALPIFCIAIFNNIIRALRWLQLLKTLGYRPGLINAFNALMFGYMVNYAVPRMGEITRCLALKKGASIPFNASFGTVITERLIDILSLLVVCIISVTWAYEEIARFTYYNMIKPVLKFWLEWSQSMLWFLLFLFIVLLVIGLITWLYRKTLLRLLRKNGIKQRIFDIWQGIISIKKVDNPWLFVVYTLLIWLNYFLSTYVWFFALGMSPSIKIGLVVMAMGSIAKSLPIQGGGLGAYHYIVTQATIIFGFSALQGNTLAIVNHGFQTVYQISLGLLGMIYFAKKIKVMSGNTRHD